MSSRWPQGQQDQRSPYATYDDGWPQGDAFDQRWQDDGWQAPDQFGYADQWGSARRAGAGQAVAQAVAEPQAPRGRAAGDFQREWDQGAGGFGDDDDLEWISYLTGGRSAQPRPDEAPPKRRSSGRQERARSRRGNGRGRRDDPGPAADSGRGGPPPISGPNATPAPRSRRAPADRAAAAGPGYQLPTLADTRYGRAPDDRQYGQAPPAWSAATGSGYDQAALAGWPVVAEPQPDEAAEAEPTGWPEPADPRFDQGSVPGWPSVDSGYDQDAVAGWPLAEPRHDEVPDADPTGWPGAGTGYEWPGPAEPQYDLAPGTGWPATEEETASTPAGAARVPARQRPERKQARRAPARQAPARKRAGAKAAAKAAPKPQPPRLLADPEPGQPVRELLPKRTGRPGGRLAVRVLAIAGAAAVVAGAAVVVLGRSGGGPAHTVTTPATLGAFTKQPRLAVQMSAAALRQQIVTESAGEAHNVVYAVYEDSTGRAAASGPQIILFIGGNLSGTSAGSFISTFTGKLQGAETTSAGSLGGAAACVPSVDGRVAECVWADDDTFGVVASQTLGTTGLASEMRQMRPLVEHVASGQ